MSREQGPHKVGMQPAANAGSDRHSSLDVPLTAKEEAV
jgi:hypothetical protein